MRIRVININLLNSKTKIKNDEPVKKQKYSLLLNPILMDVSGNF
jgi:hypothetical protein